MSNGRFDLVVIGSGPGGQKGAIAAAKMGKRVAIIDRKEMVGGVCLHTGTIPSKTLREAILYLSGFRQRSFYGKDYVLKEDLSIEDLSFRINAVLVRETDVVRAQLKRNHIVTVPGSAAFVSANEVEVTSAQGTSRLVADNFLIACGTRPAHNAAIPLDGRRIIDSDQIIGAKALPRSLIVVGAGVIGLEYASMLLALGIEVTIIEGRPTMLDFVDRELIDALTFFMRDRGATFRLGEKVASVGYDDRERVTAVLESGKEVHADALLYAVGRQANADLLNLPAAGLRADDRGRMTVDSDFRTSVPNIFAVGDVIGFPSLASASMEQGRVAALRMFGHPASSRLDLLPYGIYTIPEISMVGKTEQELTAGRIPYETGVSRWDELARGQMLGAETGMLKLLFCPKTLKLHGVHCFGEGSTEIIHVGQAILAHGGTIEYFRDAVFNYPTLSEAYKVAGLDGLNKL